MPRLTTQAPPGHKEDGNKTVTRHFLPRIPLYQTQSPERRGTKAFTGRWTTHVRDRGRSRNHRRFLNH